MQRDLVRRARDGDQDAFAVLATTAFDRLYSLAHRILRDGDRSEDAVQECLVHAWRGLRGLQDVERWDAWLNRLLVNDCYAESRRRRSRMVEVQLPSLDPAAPGDAARDIADRDQLERGFGRLPIEGGTDGGSDWVKPFP